MNKIYTCEHCKLFTTTNSGMWGKHEQNCWANPNSLGLMKTDWYCKICEIRFLKRTELTNHNYNNHMTSKQQKCSYCYKEWLTTDLHRIIHEDKCKNNPDRIIRIKCSYCNRNFNSQELTNEHELTCPKNPVHYDKEYNFTPVSENNPYNIGVYKIVSPSGKIYIGMTTKCFKERWEGHYQDLKANRHRCRGLQNAYNKYGWEQLDKIIIDEYSVPDDNSHRVNLSNHILLREQQLWDEYNNNGVLLYNSRPSASGGISFSAEQRAIMSAKQRDYRSRICPVYYSYCNICNVQVCSGSNRTKYCIKCRAKTSYNKKSNKKATTIIKKPYVKCKNYNCCNYIVNKENIKYCSPACQYKKCMGKQCCNFINKDWGIKYCNEDCKKKSTILDYDTIYDMYYNQLLSKIQIGVKFGCSEANIRHFMKNNNMRILTFRELYRLRDERNRLAYDVLYNDYVVNGLSIEKLSKKYGFSHTIISRWLKYYDITTIV